MATYISHLRHLFRLLICIGAIVLVLPMISRSQQGAVIDLPKPEKYENRSLASERTGSGRINFLKKFQQNIITHYNFYFNASLKLYDVINAAMKNAKTDYSRLIPFEEYSLESTASQKDELDSVILKCNNGILLHDLRNDWIDDLYLLMGIAYFHRKEFDSADITFQYINYAFQPRSKDEIGFEKSIGSNLNNAGNVFTISTPERKNALSRAVSHLPVRNEALLWQLRTFIEQKRMNEAKGLLETLRRDKTLPERLLPSLEELHALWFYRSEQFDSAAIYLEKSMQKNQAGNLSRKEFLAAQLFEMSGKMQEADRMYSNAISHTTDPVLEAYARINLYGLQRARSDSGRILKSLQELARMSRRSRYEDYRQIIHYAAARLEYLRGDTGASIQQLKSSIQNGSMDPSLKAKAFQELGDILFAKKEYSQAADSYDSIQTSLLDASDTQQIALKAQTLRKIASELAIIHYQDSLLKIAGLPEAELKSYVTKLSRSLRKAKGLKETESEEFSGAGAASSLLKDSEPVNLFASNEGKGDWYFYNSSLKSQGYRQFQAKWGKRPSLDNWRRIDAVNAQLNASLNSGLSAPDTPAASTQTNEPELQAPADISYEGLMANLPMTDSLKEMANQKIQSAQYQLGILFHDELDLCQESAFYLKELISRYPETPKLEPALYQLCLALKKCNNDTELAKYKAALSKSFSESKYITYLEKPETVRSEQLEKKEKATSAYDEVYTLMISGSFEEALVKKRIADSVFGESYWTAQLQYIEALYLIKERKDSLAIAALNVVREKDPGSAMAQRAENLVTVLGKRKEIERYLEALEIRRYPEDTIIVFADEPPVRPMVKVEKDSIIIAAKPLEPMVDIVKADTANLLKPSVTPPTMPVEEVRTRYLHNPADTHVVVLVLKNVDVVYRTEARVALRRYHTAYYPDTEFMVENLSLNNEEKMIMIGPFDQLGTALGYLKNARDASAKEIFPWLPAGTYQFVLVSLPNLELLLKRQNLEEYKLFLKESIPGEF